MKWLTAAMTAVILAPGAGGLWLASAHDQPLPAAQEKQDKPMKLHTADEIVAGKIEGPVRAQLIVEGWLKYQGFRPPGESQTFILKQSRPGGDRLDVLVEQKVFDRLRALGIDDPRGHFEGKAVIVAGKVHRNKGPLGDTSIIIWVRELDQIESIRKK